MNKDVYIDKLIRLECAFIRYFPAQFPVTAKLRIYPSSHSTTLHNHDFPQVWYCLSGYYTHYVGNSHYKCTRGSVVIVPPGVIHEFHVPENETAELLSLNVMYDLFKDVDPSLYINALAALFLPPFQKELGYSFPAYVVLSPESQATLEDHTSWLASIGFRLPNVTPMIQIYEKLDEIFSLPEFALPEMYRQSAILLVQTRLLPIIQALCHLNAHFPEKLVQEDLLRISSTCRARLCEDFKRFTGYSCFEYLRRLRINHAAAYMTRTVYPLSYISDVCGFTNLPHMTRLFRKYTTATPKTFREGRKQALLNKHHKK